MKDEFHYFQAGYEIVGADAGANMAYFVKSGTDPVCKDAPETSVPLNRGGAWIEKDGKLVISAEAALKNDEYASYYNGELTGNDVWTACTGWMTGMRSRDDGKQWNSTEASKAPSLQFKINITMCVKTASDPIRSCCAIDLIFPIWKRV